MICRTHRKKSASSRRWRTASLRNDGRRSTTSTSVPETAAVFDDMLDRSVPFYGEIQRMIGELASDFAVEGSSIYDLGCSTANTFLSIGVHLTPDLNVKFVGVDSSGEMLQKAEQKLANARFPWPYVLNQQDLNETVHIENASVALMVLTLQFVRPLNREALVSSLRQGMNHNGCLILVEKVLGEHSTFNRLFIDHYYEMKKRKGYSEIEICPKARGARKRPRSLSSRREPSVAPSLRFPACRCLLQVVQLLRHRRHQVERSAARPRWRGRGIFSSSPGTCSFRWCCC